MHPCHMDTSWLLNTPPLLHVEIKHSLPVYVKEATWLDDKASAVLPQQAFADPARTLPVFNKAAAFCSAIWASMNRVSDATQEAIAHACQVHGCIDDALRCTEGIKIVKSASVTLAPEQYALVIDNGKAFGLPEEDSKFLPIGSVLDAEDSITELEKAAKHNKLPVELLREASVNLMKAAARHGISVADDSVVRRLGEERYCDPNKAMFLVEHRISKVASEVLEEYKTAVEFLKTAGMENEVVEVLLDLDHRHGINYGFGTPTAQPTPWEIVFNGATENDMLKLAESMVVVAGCPVAVEAFKSVNDRLIDMRFNKEAAAVIKQAKVSDAPSASNMLAGLSDTQQLDVLELTLNAA